MFDYEKEALRERSEPLKSDLDGSQPHGGYSLEGKTELSIRQGPRKHRLGKTYRVKQEWEAISTRSTSKRAQKKRLRSIILRGSRTLPCKNRRENKTSDDYNTLDLQERRNTLEFFTVVIVSS